MLLPLRLSINVETTTAPRGPECDSNISATADFADSDTVSIQRELADPECFFQGATWSLQRLATWLEMTNIVADDEQTQRVVDATKALIAEQARHAADKIRIKE